MSATPPWASTFRVVLQAVLNPCTTKEVFIYAYSIAKYVAQAHT